MGNAQYESIRLLWILGFRASGVPLVLLIHRIIMIMMIHLSANLFSRVVEQNECKLYSFILICTLALRASITEPTGRAVFRYVKVIAYRFER